jgi:type IV secretory pathway VirB4 component
MDPILLGAVVAGGTLVLPEILGRTKGAPKEARFDAAFAQYLPYRYLVRADVLKGARSYLAAWRIAAADAGTLHEETIKGVAYQIAATLGLLGPSAMGQFYEVRARFREYDRGLSCADHPVLELLDDLREEQFLRREPVFDSQRYFVLTWTAPNAMLEAMRAAVSVGVDAQRRSEDEMIAEFEAKCRRIEASLRVALAAERLGEVVEDGRRRSELLRFVARMVSGEDRPFNVPPSTIRLNELLARDFVGGVDVRIGEDEIGVVEILTPPDEAAPMMLDRLADLDVPHTLALRVIGMSVQQAEQATADAVADLRGAADFHLSLTNPSELRAAGAMQEAYGEIGDDQKRLGRTSVAVVVRAKTRPEVILAQQAVVDALEASGFRAVVSQGDALDSFLATLPGQRGHGMRQFPIDALTVAKAVPLHERSKGLRYSDSESLPAGVPVPCVSYALGRGKSPRRVHLNSADLFHGLMCGRTRSGKSVRSAFLAAMFRGRLPLASVTIIDRGRSARPTCLMLDGEHYDVLGQRSPGFALFAGAHREDEERELLAILEEMATLQGVEQTKEMTLADRRRALLEAIRVVASRPPAERDLDFFLAMLGGGDYGQVLEPAIAAYGVAGILGDTFNRSQDAFESGRFNVIDIQNVATASDSDERFLIPLLRVIMWRLAAHERRLKEQLGDDLHSLYIVDEAHAVLNHEIGAAWALDQHKEGRKHNRGLWLVSNSPKDFAGLPRLDDLLKASQTRMYSNDPGALDPGTVGLYEKLGLPRKGIEMLPLIGERGVVLHGPETGTLCEIDFKLDEDVRAVLGSSRTNKLVDRYLEAWSPEKYGAQRWKTEMLLADPSPQARAAGTRLQTILERGA